MSWFNYLGFGRRSVKRVKQTTGRAATMRPLLETLEDRCVPSAVVRTTPVVQPNLPPALTNDWADTDGTTAVTINVLANDHAPFGATLLANTVQVASTPPAVGGTATVETNGEIKFQAYDKFSGTGSFTYSVKDSFGDTATALVSVRVNRPNAADVWADTDGNTPVKIDVLANDTDPDGNQHLGPSSVNLYSFPANGTAKVNPATGKITYTALGTFTGTDSFQYTVTDDHGGVSEPGTVYVRVNRPVASDVNAQTTGTVTIDVLQYDNDPDGIQHLVPSSVFVHTGALYGTTSVNTKTGQITYTPGSDFLSHGSDTFQYTVSDDNGGVSLPGTVTITVGTGTPTPPVYHPTAADDWTDTDGTTPVPLNVLANDTDPHGTTSNNFLNPASVTIVTNPSHGQVSVNPSTGQVTYTNNGNFTGTDSFQYTVADDNGEVSNTATAYVRVNNPIAGDGFAKAYGTMPVKINVLANDEDPDGKQHLVPSSIFQHIVSYPQDAAQFSVNPKTGQIIYIAKPGWSGTDTFKYQVSDDNGGLSNTATVVVNTEVPQAVDATVHLNGASAVAFNLAPYFTDPSGPAALKNFIITITSKPADGTLLVNQVTHLITFIPTASFKGNDTFTYTISDSHHAKSLEATVTLDV